jgi:sphingolipid delta-4 desaturase
MWSRWSFVNFLAAAAYDAALIYFCGWPGLLYLAFSFLLSIGLHPVGARWIQEHYTYDSSQETFSYYGPINLIALNVGYHNEHHDFPSIPWNRLPTLRVLAPESYETLKYHTSWSRLLVDFIFDKRYSLFSRVERMKQNGRVTAPSATPAIVDPRSPLLAAKR